jgi:hypothetical protein
VPQYWKSFKNIGRIVGSRTGTPPWLLYKNYIGYYVPMSYNTFEQLPANARVILCNGPCEPFGQLNALEALRASQDNNNSNWDE